jgi:xanthine dehydrogenase accessory factor
MKEIPAIIKACRELPKGARAALATVIGVEGSSYRRPGARMLVAESGRWTGGISGGCLEGDALQKAKYALLQNRASTVVYDTRDEDAHQIGVGLGCNGRIEVLIAPLPADDSPGNPITVLEQLLHCREPQVLVTTVATPADSGAPEPGAMQHWNELEKLPGSMASASYGAALSEAIARARQSGQSEIIAHGEYRAFVEVWTPPVHLALFGGNYDIAPMVRLAKELGWIVSVTANLQKTNRDLLAGADNQYQSGRDFPVIDAHSAIILMAHDYATDFRNLLQALQTDAPYIGLLGPKSRAERLCEGMAAEGFSMEEQRGRLFGPAGLDIGATAPETIALSILAEIQTCFSGREGGALRDREGPVYN